MSNNPLPLNDSGGTAYKVTYTRGTPQTLRTTGKVRKPGKQLRFDRKRRKQHFTIVNPEYIDVLGGMQEFIEQSGITGGCTLNRCKMALLNSFK